MYIIIYNETSYTVENNITAIQLDRRHAPGQEETLENEIGRE